MTDAHVTKNCVVCQSPFVVRTNNRGHAKYCSKACQRAGQGYKMGLGKVAAVCTNCGVTFQYYPSIRTGKYCSRECRNMAFSRPSAERGFIDLTGRMFGRWTVLAFCHRKGQHLYWEVRCSCKAATEKIISGHSLRQGESLSCGCRARERPRPDVKACTRCKRTLPYDDKHFSTHPAFKWGLRPICRECWRPIAGKRHLRFRRRLKLEVLTHYSQGAPRCACCGVTEIEFLTLDHINDDGKEDRKKHGLGAMFYARMKKLGYPTHLQVLCFNCNIARSHFGICPHKADKMGD